MKSPSRFRLSTVLCLVVSCGNATEKKVRTAAVTSPGNPSGEVVSSPVGPAGGMVASADGRLTLVVPPAALAAEAILTVQSIESTAPGGVRAWRLGPEGQTFLTPVSLVVAYQDDDVAGSAPEALEFGFQNANGTWSVLKEVSLDAAAKTLTAETTHFSDWSLLQGVQLRPLDATVLIGKTVTLIVNSCNPVDQGGEDGLVSLLAACEPDELVLRSADWRVNNVLGGNGTVGTIAPQEAGTAVFTAPPQKPTPSSVAVSTEFTREARAGRRGVKGLLVSNITVVGMAGWSGTVRYTVSGSKTTEESGREVDGNTTFTKTTVKSVSGNGTIVLEPAGFPGAATVSDSMGSWSESSVETTDAVNNVTVCGYTSKLIRETALSGDARSAISAFAIFNTTANTYSLSVGSLDGDLMGTLTTSTAVTAPKGMSAGCVNAVPLNMTTPSSGNIPSDPLALEGMINPATPNMIMGAKTFTFGTDPIRTYEVSWQFKQ